MALPVNGSTHLIPAYYSIYRPRKDERLSWPSWLTYSGWLTHISGHPSAAGRAQDRESSPARDRRSTTVPRHQPFPYLTQNTSLLWVESKWRILSWCIIVQANKDTGIWMKHRVYLPLGTKHVMGCEKSKNTTLFLACKFVCYAPVFVVISAVELRVGTCC